MGFDVGRSKANKRKMPDNCKDACKETLFSDYRKKAEKEYSQEKRIPSNQVA